jgi:hypothetical protein
MCFPKFSELLVLQEKLTQIYICEFRENIIFLNAEVFLFLIAWGTNKGFQDTLLTLLKTPVGYYSLGFIPGCPSSPGDSPESAKNIQSVQNPRKKRYFYRGSTNYRVFIVNTFLL